LYARAASKLVHVVDLAPAMFVANAFRFGSVSIMTGHYHDGYVPNGGSAFIFADQIWLLMVVIVHTLEYIEAL
jgi:hypothetical protein